LHTDLSLQPIRRIPRAATTLIVVAAVCLMVACGATDESPERTVVVKNVVALLPSLDAPAATPARHQVAFIGIDGGTWRFIEPMIAAGELPNLARMQREGATGTLRSVPCYVSPPAWTTLATGYVPEKTGIYTFGRWNRSTRSFEEVTAADIAVPSVWDVASRAGRKVAVANVPMTYPVREVNGVMVSGLMTPLHREPPPALKPLTPREGPRLSALSRQSLRTYSRPQRSAATDSLNTYFWWWLDSSDDDVTNYDQIALNVVTLREAEADLPGALYVFDKGEYSPWIRVDCEWNGEIYDAWCKTKVYQPDDGTWDTKFSRRFVTLRATSDDFAYPPEFADTLFTRFETYIPTSFVDADVAPSMAQEYARYASFLYDYDDWDMYYYVFTSTDNIQHLEGFSQSNLEIHKTIDRFIGELMDRMPNESTLIVASDHGFKEFGYSVDMNVLLEQMGLLTRGEDNKIDYEKSHVFHNLWYLYFNEQLLTAEDLAKVGVTVAAGETPRAALLKTIQRYGAAVELADGSKSLPLEFIEVEPGAVGDAPDALVKGSYDDYMVEFWNLKRPRPSPARTLHSSERNAHERDGIILLWGDRMRRNVDIGTRDIQDIAPTVLYLLGLPIAADMDGRPMFEALGESTLANQPEYVVADFAELEIGATIPTRDRKSFEDKLRSLGYVR